MEVSNPARNALPIFRLSLGSVLLLLSLLDVGISAAFGRIMITLQKKRKTTDYFLKEMYLAKMEETKNLNREKLILKNICRNMMKEALVLICSLLNKHDVDYLVIGGVAVIFHGYTRATGDLDFWYKPSLDNFHKIIKAFKEYGIDVSVSWMALTCPL
jgi:hypothetical protein